MKKPSQEILDEARFYQYVLNGKTYRLSEMDRGQLMRALMKSIDTIEYAQGKLADVSDLLECWSTHGDLPDT